MSWGTAMTKGRKIRLNRMTLTPLMRYEMMGLCLTWLRQHKRRKVKRDYTAEHYVKRLCEAGYPEIHPYHLNFISQKVFGMNWRTVKQKVLRGDYVRRCKPEELK